MTISRRLRFEVLRRDNHTCRYCGATAADGPITIDHVTPIALGGTDNPANLVAACVDCNAGKSSIQPGAALVADVEQSALRWSQAMERALAMRRERSMDRDAELGHWWSDWQGWHNTETGEKVPLPDDWENSIERWLDAGLNLAMLREFIPKAMRKKGCAMDERFNYFAGIAWSTLTDLQREARQLLEAEDAREAWLTATRHYSAITGL